MKFHHKLQVQTHGDSTKPRILAARIAYSTGVLTITMSEIIDTTISNAVLLDNFFISDSSGAALISLLGASVHNSESLEIQITLTELQRIRAIEVSAVAGGNGGAARRFRSFNSSFHLGIGFG